MLKIPELSTLRHAYISPLGSLLFCILTFLILLFPVLDVQASPTEDEKVSQQINELSEPLYNPFTERYLLDEVRTLRQGLADAKIEFHREMANRELDIADKALTYATDTVTYFFYLIAGVSTLLVLVGWNSLREIKERVATMANEEILRITANYEERLNILEQELQHKSQHIRATREEIELTNEIHSLWLKATQEPNPQGKIAIYDQILALRPDDIEALTYKADAALLLGQCQWATSLANRALTIDPENSHALYQRACASAENGFWDDAISDLTQAISFSHSLREQALRDSSFASLKNDPRFKVLFEIEQ